MAKKLYGIVQWTNDNPILDGIVYFIEKKRSFRVYENFRKYNYRKL